jgi:transposase-like protein
MCAAKNGVSALELSRKLGISYRPAWHMAHRIRLAITRAPLAEMIKGTIEADETYIGGKAKFMHKAKRERVIQGRGAVNKVAVLSAVERGGQVRSQKIQAVSSKNILDVLRARVSKDAILNTDTLPSYNQVGKEFAAHQTVDHSKGEYVRGNAHVNTAEGYFSQLKRSLSGTYHHVSEKHLDRYLAEFDYRYSTRQAKDGDRTQEAMQKTRGKKLTYRALTQTNRMVKTCE